MALFVGIDDTDSRSGGCTTSLADDVAALFPQLRLDGPPRLVRLNPNVPWKTRGNGAVALAFEGDANVDDALRSVRSLVEREARREPGTSPGVVVSRAPIDRALYEAAVTRVVPRAEALHALARADARWWGGRGVIGAAAAVAWPAEPPPRETRLVSPLRGSSSTWERIAYRASERIGTPRDVLPLRVEMVECALPTLFDTFDLDENEVVCLPSSPCPVLWGVRGTDPHELERASRLLGPERPARETLFLTNHASDDHLVDRMAADARGCVSARVRGRLAADPVERNGSVFATLEDASGRVRIAAYPPTRGFRKLVAALRAGDDITAMGGVHWGPLQRPPSGQAADATKGRGRGGVHAGPDGGWTIGLEKLFVHDAPPRAIGNPFCPACGRAMKSAGRGAGYRCHGHRTSAPRKAPSFLDGWHEVPACARRHLARPLKLGLENPPPSNSAGADDAPWRPERSSSPASSTLASPRS